MEQTPNRGMSNVPVAKVRAIGHQNAPLIDRDLVVVEDDLHVEEEVVIGEDALVEDVEDGILEMVKIRQSMPP